MRPVNYKPLIVAAAVLCSKLMTTPDTGVVNRISDLLFGPVDGNRINPFFGLANKDYSANENSSETMAKDLRDLYEKLHEEGLVNQRDLSYLKMIQKIASALNRCVNFVEAFTLDSEKTSLAEAQTEINNLLLSIPLNPNNELSKTITQFFAGLERDYKAEVMDLKAAYYLQSKALESTARALRGLECSKEMKPLAETKEEAPSAPQRGQSSFGFEPITRTTSVLATLFGQENASPLQQSDPLQPAQKNSKGL